MMSIVIARSLIRYYRPLSVQFVKISSAVTLRSTKLYGSNMLKKQEFVSIGYGISKSCKYSAHNTIDDETVDFEYVKSSIDKQDVLIVDVREPEEIKEHGKIHNSINIPVGNIHDVFNQMSEKDFQSAYQKMKPNKDTEIIFYCMIGKRSGKAQQTARNLGFKNAKNYLGSWNDWASNTQKN